MSSSSNDSEYASIRLTEKEIRLFGGKINDKQKKLLTKLYGRMGALCRKNISGRVIRDILDSNYRWKWLASNEMALTAGLLISNKYCGNIKFQVEGIRSYPEVKSYYILINHSCQTRDLSYDYYQDNLRRGFDTYSGTNNWLQLYFDDENENVAANFRYGRSNTTDDDLLCKCNPKYMAVSYEEFADFLLTTKRKNGKIYRQIGDRKENWIKILVTQAHVFNNYQIIVLGFPRDHWVETKIKDINDIASFTSLLKSLNDKDFECAISGMKRLHGWIN